jgi:hypothetical protein
MAPSTTHQLVSSGAFAAREAGALDGHQAVCACGFVARTSLALRFAERDLYSHAEYMNRKAARR